MFGSELTIGALPVEGSCLRCGVLMVWLRLSPSSYCRCSRTGRSHLWSCCRQHVQHSMDLLMILLSQKMLSTVFLALRRIHVHMLPLPAHGQRHLRRRPPHHLGEEHSLRSVISGLVAVCEATRVSIQHLTTEVHALRQQLLRNAACPPRPAPSPPPPPSPPTVPTRGRLPPRQMCRRIGCDSHPHVSCAVGYCVTHCTSPRCQHPSTRPRRRRRVRRTTPITVPVPQSRDSAVLPPSLSSARVPPPPRPHSFRPRPPCRQPSHWQTTPSISLPTSWLSGASAP